MNLIPQSEELERGVLGGLLLNQNEYPDIAELFHEDLFYHDANKIVCRAIKALKNDGKYVDIIAITEWVKSKGHAGACSPHHITNLTNTGILSGFLHDVLILNQYYIRRKLILKNTEVIKEASLDGCDVFDLLSEQEKNLNEIIGKISVSRTPDMQDCYLELVDHLNKIQALKAGQMAGVDTGFNELNDYTAGWQKTDLIILAARPGMGKTSLMLNFVRNALVPTLVFSLEMSKLQLTARLCSQVTSIPLSKFLFEKMDEGEKKVFNQFTYDLSNRPIYVEDKGGIDMTFIKTRARRMVREKKIELIVIDYLQIISRAKSGKSTNDEISEVSGGLKALAKELQVPIIALSQLTREVEKRADKTPVLSDLRDGGSIEQDADMVMFIFRPEYYGINDDGYGNSTIGKSQVIIAKQRNGGLGTLTLGFDGKCTNFYSLRQNSGLEPNTHF